MSNKIAPALFLLFAISAAQGASPNRWDIPGYNRPAQEAQPGARRLSTSNNKYEQSYKDFFGKGTGAEQAGTAQRPIMYVEWGANSGRWTDRMMKRATEQGKVARCFMFEPQTFLVEGATRTVAERHNCTLVPKVVWKEADEFEFYMQSRYSIASSVIEGGYTTSNRTTKIKVQSVDAAQWLVENVKPSDYIYLRMDIEGAEYTVLSHMLLKGVACWLDVIELEMHALHHKSNYNKRPADVVLPWLMRQCGVDVRMEAYYPNKLYDPDDKYCRHCEMLKIHHSMD